MTKTASRILTVVVALSLLASGPLAPLAMAQQPAQPAQPPQQQPMPQPEPLPAAQPAQPVVIQPDVPEQDSRTAETAAYNAGAIVADVFYIPGKALLCGLGGMVGIAILIISIGSAPRPAAYFAREGCGGKWVLTGDDLRPDDTHYRAFDWESDSRY